MLKKSFGKTLLIVTASLMVLACTQSSSDIVVVELGDQTDVVDAKQRQLIADVLKLYPNQTQFSISLIRGENVQFYGIKRENDVIKETENFDKAFEIGSISKAFTATILADFVYNNEVKLDEPINTYYGFSFNNDIQLSFKNLSNHTSGLPALPSNMSIYARTLSDNPYRDYDGAALETYLQNKLQLDKEPGTEIGYSNLGAGLLGYTLSKVSNKSYEQLLQERIFNLYKMSNSSSRRDKLGKNLVKGLDADGTVTSNWDLDALAGAGAILSTVEDLSQFALAHFDPKNKTLALTRNKTTQLTQQLPFGNITPALGWFYIETNTGDSYVWHNGGTGGYRSEMAVDVDNQHAVIILSNISSFHEQAGEMDRLVFLLMDTL